MDELSFEYPKACTLVDVSDIIQEGRARSYIRDGYIEELADSIAQVGLVHPPTLSANNTLLGGGCRIQAIRLLGSDVIPVIYREEMPSYLIKEAELHENDKRLSMTWQEKVILIHDAHRLRQHEGALQGQPWYQKDTGKLFGQSAASVVNALKLAEYIIKQDNEVLNCEKITDALNILIARAEESAMSEQIKRHGTTVNIKPETRESDIAVVSLESGQDNLSVLPLTPDTPSVPQPSFEATSFDLGEMFHLGNCIEIMSKMKHGCVDHVVSDIPYGIDVEQMDIQFKETIANTHEVNQNVDMMPEFLEQSYRLIGTKGGFCVFFYDLDHHEKLMGWAEKVGFEVCHWPYIWVKTHPCQNKSAQYNFTKCTEYAMICRRNGDAPTTLIQNWPKNYIMCDAATERKMYSNPFAKPAAVWNDILEHIAFTGQTVLDPYAGQFSSGRAMINNGLKPMMIEIEKYHFIRGVQGAMELLQKITNGQAVFKNNPLENIEM